MEEKTFKLKFPVKVGNGLVEEITFRMLTLGDLIDIAAHPSETEYERNVRLLSMTSSLDKSVIEEMYEEDFESIVSKEEPDFFAEPDNKIIDGSYKLLYPFEDVHGNKLESLPIKRLKVKDVIRVAKMQSSKESDLQYVANKISAVVDLSPASMRKMPAVEFKHLNFLIGDFRRPKTALEE